MTVEERWPLWRDGRCGEVAVVERWSLWRVCCFREVAVLSSSFQKSPLPEDQRPHSVGRRELPVLSVRNSQVARERDKAFMDTAMQALLRCYCLCSIA